jgi:phosphoribosylformimino-5-aminoimidazole carboxamide ribotide isomerase
MRIIPVIDLRAGEAVHGIGGARTRYEPVKSVITPSMGDALALAQAYVSVLGTSELYVADLDAIEGGAAQYEMHRRLSRITRSWIDAGVRAEADAFALIDAGADRVVVALETLPGFELLQTIVLQLGADRVAFSLDLRDGTPLASSDVLRAMTPRELARRAVDAGAETVILLDLARVGSSAGADEAMMRDIRAALPGVDLVAGGGVRHQIDLDRLAAAGANGALVATAVHRGVIGRVGPTG